MKKWIFMICGLIILLIGCYSVMSSYQYNKKIQLLYWMSISGQLDDIYVYQYSQHEEYPLSFLALVDSINPEIYGSKEKTIMALSSKDILSRHKDDIQYIPLYDRQSKKRESFILLSAGVDGHLDNYVSITDTIYIDSWWIDLDVYNYFEAVLLKDHYEKGEKLLEVIDPGELCNYHIPMPKLSKFNVWNYYFGRKDYIIQLGARYNAVPGD